MTLHPPPSPCIPFGSPLRKSAGFSTRMAAERVPDAEEFHDFLPVMAQKLGGDDFMAELCNGFRLLADEAAGAITFQSLKKNAACLGLQDMSDEELIAMIKEGDSDGDGMLNEQEFCILMVRTSPTMMEEGEEWLGDALAQELEDFMDEEGNMLDIGEICSFLRA